MTLRVAICKGDYSGKVDLSKSSLIISVNELYKKFSNQENVAKEKGSEGWCSSDTQSVIKLLRHMILCA